MDPGFEGQSFLRDFFFELFKDPDNLREHYQLEREIWFCRLNLNRKEEHLFELEMYLRAIGCFFNLHNQFISDRDRAITRDFTDELMVLGAALRRGIALSRLLLDQGLAKSMNFQSYVRNQVAPDYLRLQMLRRTLDQKRPEESLFLLNSVFGDLKKLIDQLLKRPPCTYQLFYHLGQIVNREIAFNRFFNPLLILEFRPEYDRIRSVTILDAINAIETPAERRATSKLFLALFRLQHYLRYIPRQGKAHIMRRSLILFTLFHSEANTLAGFLRILGDRSQVTNPELAEAAAEVADGIQARLIQMFGDELVTLDVERSSLLGDQERPVASCRELLQEFLKDCIVRFVRVYRPDVDAKRLLDPALSQQEQSIRLRSDLWLFKRMIERFVERLGAGSQSVAETPEHLLRFSDYFLHTSCNLLRYGDGGPFECYHSILAEEGRSHGNSIRRVRFGEDTRQFLTYLVRTYDLVCRRAELTNASLALDVQEDLLGRWMAPDVSTQGPGKVMQPTGNTLT